MSEGFNERVADFLEAHEWVSGVFGAIIAIGVIVGLIALANSDWAENMRTNDRNEKTYVYVITYTIHYPSGSESVTKSGEMYSGYEPECKKVLRKRGVFIRVNMTDIYKGKDDVTINSFKYHKKYQSK